MTDPTGPAMMKIAAKTAVLMTLVLLSLCGGCSGREAVNRPREKEAQEFSSEEKSAARMLSINHTKSVTDAASPYAKALLCKNGLDMTAQRLRSLSIMNAQQRQLLQQAQTYFDRQLHELGERQGMSTTDIRRDLDQTAQNHSDAEENARIAVTCLQGQ